MRQELQAVSEKATLQSSNVRHYATSHCIKLRDDINQNHDKCPLFYNLRLQLIHYRRNM